MGELTLIEVSNAREVIEFPSNKDRAPPQPFHSYVLLKMRFIGTVIEREVLVEKVELEFSWKEFIESA